MEKNHILSFVHICCFILIIAFIFPTQAIAQRMTQKKVERTPARIVENDNVLFELDFESFEKERDFLDEPFDFSSAEAKEVWDFLVSKKPHLKMEPKDMRFHLGSFARLGLDSYLIEHYAFFYVRPKQNIFIELTTNLPPGNYDLGEIRKLGKNKFWLLLSGSDYKHDIASKIYYALIFEKKPDNSFWVQSVHITDFACRGYDDEQTDGLCGGNDEPNSVYPVLESAADVNKFIVKDINHDGKDDVIFYTTEQNCKTKKKQKRKRTFINMGNRFVEKVLTR
jgi:hypothetical protein